MTVSANEILSQLPPERQQKIAERAKELQPEYQTIRDIRKARALTQEQLAKALRIKQSNVSQIEKRSDIFISTLRSYIEAMGGDLHLVAEFPGRPAVFIDGLIAHDDEATEEPYSRSRRRQTRDNRTRREGKDLTTRTR